MAAKKKPPKAKKAARKRRGRFIPPDQVVDVVKRAVAEAAAYRGLGRGPIAVQNRRRRIGRLLDQDRTYAEIAVEVGYSESYIRTVAAKLRAQRRDLVTSFDLLEDAATQTAIYRDLEIRALEALDMVDPRHPAWSRTYRGLIMLERTKDKFLERAGLRTALDLGAPPDTADLQGRSTEQIEDELAILTLHIARRVTKGGWIQFVERMRTKDLVEAPELRGLELLPEPTEAEIPEE